MAKTNLKVFYDKCRKGILNDGGGLDAGEVEGLAAILAHCETRGLTAAQTAYVLATAFHETAGTMQPVKEYGGNAYFFRMYDPKGARPKLARDNGNIHPGDGVKFPGRGLVQLTWRGNYLSVGRKIGHDLIANPDLAMRMDIAAIILVDGMIGAWFCPAHGLNDHIPRCGKATKVQYESARRIINGVDKKSLIADEAIEFYGYLVATGWPV